MAHCGRHHMLWLQTTRETVLELRWKCPPLWPEDVIEATEKEVISDHNQMRNLHI